MTMKKFLQSLFFLTALDFVIFILMIFFSMTDGQPPAIAAYLGCILQYILAPGVISYYTSFDAGSFGLNISLLLLELLINNCLLLLIFFSLRPFLSRFFRPGKN